MPRILSLAALLSALVVTTPVALGRQADDGSAAAGISPQDRDTVEKSFVIRFVYPETTIWQFDLIKPYFGGENVICGRVTSEDSRQTYQRQLPFFAILSDGAVVDSGIGGEPAHDVLGSLERKLRDVCPESVKATQQSIPAKS